MNDLHAPGPEAANDTTMLVEPPTERERTLVRSAMPVVRLVAQQVARKFPRLVGPTGMRTVEDLEQIGFLALYPLARAYSEDQSPEFSYYVRRRIRDAMLGAIDDDLFEHRIQRAAMQVEDRYCAYSRDKTYDVMKHDEEEVRRRYRAFANGLLAATFGATTEEAIAAARHDEDVAQLQAFARAIAVLGAAISRLDATEQQIFLWMYRERLDLKAACEKLRIPYGQAKERHRRTLQRFRALLFHYGIMDLPEPLRDLTGEGRLELWASPLALEPSPRGGG